MAIDGTDPAPSAPSSVPSQHELLVSALLHLMSQYIINVGETGACIKLASVIERHLKALANLPDLAPMLRATCLQLSEQSTMVVERAMPQPRPRPDKRKLFTRLVSGTRSH